MKLKKGALGIDSLGGLAITFVVAAITIGFGSLILSELGDDVYSSDGNSTAYNITGDGEEALGKFAQWLPTLAIIVVAAVIIAVIVGAFYIGGRE
jgi:amino acid transporter